MSINKAEQMLKDRLVNEIQDLKTEQVAIKTRNQPVGADVLDVVWAGVTVVGPITIAGAGGGLLVTLTTTPVSNFVLTLYNFEFTLYVDGTTSDDKYPNGANMTGAKRNIKLQWWLDYADSNEDGDNHRTHKIRIVNEDTVPHDYYLKMITIYPRYSSASS